LIEQLSETLQLLFRMAGVVPVAVRQVSHQSFDAEGFPRRQCFEQRRQLVRRQAQAPHARIDLDMNGEGQVLYLGRFGERREQAL
jgi:hypothetical protein